ncbi:EamA family transporter RarD [Herminiimonas contaminans]|uniref:EamA family transporter RarD n=1 Tax=Herminiimonas contaminans TaxID=1111140 RepID=A0ABS0EY49_9BURK|nr:EamA family transporter RarD [Herminiimonas contaminans]MBF8179009.1 EamA family transporter RarD [Herminiimonas contaminans]
MSKGITFSVTSSVLFAVLYFYSTLLTPLNGEEIFGWRTLLTFPFLTLFIWSRRQQGLVLNLLHRMRQNPSLVIGVLATSAFLGVQLWLFMWAPLHGRALNVSLGYFLLPLTMLMTGRIIYKERLSRLQNLAAMCAAVGVTNELINVGSLSWETMVVALGYPVYFVLRRRLGSNNIGGLWFDMIFLLPAGAWFVYTGDVGIASLADYPRLYALIPILGVISAFALLFYMIASQTLSLSLFGLLGYVEPVLLVVVALLLGETIEGAQWLTYIPIWIAVLLLIVEGVKNVYTRHNLKI